MKCRSLSTAKSTVTFKYISSIYWAAATSASVGYGDVYAHTAFEVSTTVIPCSRLPTSKMKESTQYWVGNTNLNLLLSKDQSPRSRDHNLIHS